MEIKVKGFTLDTYREDKYDATDFDHIKDALREKDLTSTMYTILCGELFYNKLRHIMHDYIMAQPTGQFGDRFKEYGILFHFCKVTELQPWSGIIIEGVIEI